MGYGHRVRVITRDPEKLKGLKDPDFEVMPGDFRKRGALGKALQGVDGAYLMTPCDEGPQAETAFGKAMIDACAEQVTGHVV